MRQTLYYWGHAIATLVRLVLMLVGVRLTPRHAVLDDGVRRDDDGLPVIWLRGNAYTRGYQHGHHCRAELHAYHQVSWAYAADTAVQRLGMPARLAPWLIRPLLTIQAATYLPVLSPAVRAEMQGIADGAGLAVRDILVNTVIWELFGMLLGPSSGPLHCSEWAADATQTQGGSLFGYNYDVIVPTDRTIIEPYLALFVVTDGTAHYVTLNPMGSIGVNTAMNAAGVAFGWDNSYLATGTAGSPPYLPFMLTLRDVALHAQHASDAMARLRSAARPHADMCVVVDPVHVGVVELAGDASAVRCEPVVWSCNRLQQLRDRDYYGRGRAPDARHDRYPQLLASLPRPMTPATMAQVLRDQGGGEGRQIADTNTTFAVIYAPATRVLWVAAGGTPASYGTFRCYTLNGERRRTDDLPAASTA